MTGDAVAILRAVQAARRAIRARGINRRIDTFAGVALTGAWVGKSPIDGVTGNTLARLWRVAHDVDASACTTAIAGIAFGAQLPIVTLRTRQPWSVPAGARFAGGVIVQELAWARVGAIIRTGAERVVHGNADPVRAALIAATVAVAAAGGPTLSIDADLSFSAIFEAATLPLNRCRGATGQ